MLLSLDVTNSYPNTFQAKALSTTNTGNISLTEYYANYAVHYYNSAYALSQKSHSASQNISTARIDNHQLFYGGI